MRIQFIPSTALQSQLVSESQRLGISISALTVEILETYYGLNTDPLTKLLTTVYSEIDDYLKEHTSGTMFSLYDASKSYREIPMSKKNKPAATRMQIGNNFNRECRQGRYAGLIEQVYNQKGEPLRTAGNKASVFVII